MPGVGLGFHTDPTKSTQYAPQINGGNGRNVNYQIDGGDNNDDTVGGLLQLFPLEAIQEFNFLTAALQGRVRPQQRRRAERRHQERHQQLSRQLLRVLPRQVDERADRDREAARTSTSRTTAATSSAAASAARSRRTRRTSSSRSSARSRTRRRRSTRRGCSRPRTASSPTPYRENLFTGKVTANLDAAQYLSVRYGRNNELAAVRRGANSTLDNWGDSTNKFNSINLNHNWVLGGSKLNEFIFQYADFGNHIASRSSDPNETFPNGVTIGAERQHAADAPSRRSTSSATTSRGTSTGMGGLGHDFKAGVNFINEPRLFITFNTGKGVDLQHAPDQRRRTGRSRPSR